MISIHLKPTDNIQDILNGYPLNEALEVHLEPGRYVQKLQIKHSHLKLFGSKTSPSVISYGDYSYKMHEDGLLYNTFRTETMMILGNHVELHNLVIENTAGSGFTIGQAVALTLYGDDIKLYSCKLLGHQDTLFLGPLPVDLTERYDHFLPTWERQTKHVHHFFKDCYIEGDVDFIFGSSTGLFDHCEIVALSKGYITAPSTYEKFEYGMIFSHCKIISKSDHEDVLLGRPWREHGSSVFYQCIFEGLFDIKRFHDWDKKIYRFFEFPYHDSPFSKTINEEAMEQLKIYVLKHFNCSIQ